MAAAVALLTVGVGAGLWWRADQARSVTRGGNGGVALLTPPNAEIGTGSALAWRPVDRVVRYEVEIRTLRGELVARQELTDTVAVITLPDGAETGQSAYWSVVARLEDGSDVRSAPRPIRLVRK
jgi:hypothetical protein